MAPLYSQVLLPCVLLCTSHTTQHTWSIPVRQKWQPGPPMLSLSHPWDNSLDTRSSAPRPTDPASLQELGAHVCPGCCPGTQATPHAAAGSAAWLGTRPPQSTWRQPCWHHPRPGPCLPHPPATCLGHPPGAPAPKSPPTVEGHLCCFRADRGKLPSPPGRKGSKAPVPLGCSISPDFCSAGCRGSHL